MEQETLKIIKKERIMTILLIFLLLLFVSIVLFVNVNKDKDIVIEEPIDSLDAGNYVKLENIDTNNYSTVYKSVNIKKVTFVNITDVLVSNFYTKQEEYLNSLDNNINANKELIDNYNKNNNILDYSANSKIESIILYELNDDILSLIYLIEDTVDYKGLNNYITNVFIDVKNNSVVNNDILLQKYHYSKEEVSSLVFDSIIESHEDKFINKDTGEEINKSDITAKKDDYVKNLVDNFDSYIYLYFYQDNLYLKYNKSDLSRILFNENLENVKYSTLKLNTN